MQSLITSVRSMRARLPPTLRSVTGDLCSRNRGQTGGVSELNDAPHRRVCGFRVVARRLFKEGRPDLRGWGSSPAGLSSTGALRLRYDLHPRGSKTHLVPLYVSTRSHSHNSLEPLPLCNWAENPMS